MNESVRVPYGLKSHHVAFIISASFLFISICHALSGETSLARQIEGSDLAIQGTLVSTDAYETELPLEYAYRDSSGNSARAVENMHVVITEYTLEIAQVFKGEYPNDQIAVVSFGGKTDQKQLITSDHYLLTKAKTYVIFLVFDPKSKKWWPFTGAQGIYEILEVDGRKYARSINKEGIATRSGEIIPGEIHALQRQIPLEVFLAELQGK